MSEMNKLAAVVAKHIRENVKKPKSLPAPFMPPEIPEERSKDFVQESGISLRWTPKQGIRYKEADSKYTGRCPLGFLTKVDAPTPIRAAETLKLKLRHTQAFIKWWDQQTNAKAAVKAIWG